MKLHNSTGSMGSKQEKLFAQMHPHEQRDLVNTIALQVMIIFERLAESKHHPRLQIWQEGGTRELLACQYYLYPWKGDAAPLSGGLRYQHG